MNAAEYHDLRFGTRCAFCARPLVPATYTWSSENWLLPTVPSSWRPCACAESRAAGQIGMRYEDSQLRLARMEPST